MGELTRAAKDFRVGEYVWNVQAVHIEKTEMQGNSVMFTCIFMAHKETRLQFNSEPHGNHHYLEFPSACSECAEEERAKSGDLCDETEE